MIALLAQVAAAATLTVGPTGDYPTLSEAAEAAEPGDTLLVQAGTYAEALFLTKDLTLQGIDGAGATTLTSDDVTLTAGATRLHLEGLTLTSTGSRAVYATGTALTLQDVVITGVQSTSSGAGLTLVGGSLSGADLTFSDCVSDGGSGGLLYASGAELVLTRARFTGGEAQRGGAVWLGSSTASFTDTEFLANQALPGSSSARGGAIRAESSELTLVGVTLEDNRADRGFGGAVSAYLSTLLVQDSRFEGNIADDAYGGALVLWDGDAALEGVEFTNNLATDLSGTGNSHGGAVYALGDAAGALALVDVRFLYNAADSNGGAVRVSAGDFSAVGVVAEGNEASSGGALHLSTRSDIGVSDCTFTGNLASYGGAVRWKPEHSSSDLSLTGCTFTDNTAVEYGGAVYAYDGGILLLEDSTFEANTAALGGAVMAWGVDTVTAEGNLFCANAALGSPSADGGAALVYQGAWLGHRWAYNTFVGNTAEGVGGALKLSVSGDAELVNNHLLGNAATSGAALLVRGTDAGLRNNLVAWSLGAEALQADSGAAVSWDWTALWANEDDTDSTFDAAEGDGSVELDPLLTRPSVALGGVCTLSGLGLRPDSPLRDAGDPSLSDPDGSRADIGAFGGPGAHLAAFTDGDKDGWAALDDCDDTHPDLHPFAEELPYDGLDQDCDGADLDDVDGDGFTGGPEGADCADEDPTAHPGAAEVWYDGLDQDCDGADDFDQDGDGFGALEHGGEDCDDLDGAVHPDATETPSDDLDSDCDGLDDPPEDAGEDPEDRAPATPKRCSATAPSGGPALVWGLGLALLLGRRRRS